MKKLLTVFALVLHFSINAQTDPELFPVNDRKAGHLGYYLEDGTNVVKPQFCSASYNIDGYYIVSKAEHEYYEDGRRKEEHIPDTEKFGLLNRKGEFIIDFNNNYDGIGVRNGVIYVIKNQFYGTVNDKNKIVIPIEYNVLNIEGKNRIIAGKNNKYGIYNYLGDTIIPFQYDFVGTPMPGEKDDEFLVIVQIKNKMGVINQQNQLVVPITEFRLSDLYKTTIVATDGKKFGVFDYKLNQILPFEFEMIDVDEEEIKATKTGYQYYYTLSGELVKKESTSEGEKSSQ